MDNGGSLTSRGRRPSSDPSRQGRPTLAVLAAIAACALLAACAPPARPVPLATASMSAADREAFDEATAAVGAYLQTVADLYTGQRTSLDDLAAVAVDPELKSTWRGIAEARGLGHRSEPLGAQVTVTSATPYSVELDADPPTVLLTACVDATDVIAVSPLGRRQSGLRERQQFRVVHDESLPAPGWGVSEVSSVQRLRDRAC